MSKLVTEKSTARPAKAVKTHRHEPRSKTPSDYLCTHSKTASGLYALELLDRLHADGRLTLDEVKAMVVAYDNEQASIPTAPTAHNQEPPAAEGSEHGI